MSRVIAALPLVLGLSGASCASSIAAPPAPPAASSPAQAEPPPSLAPAPPAAAPSLLPAAAPPPPAPLAPAAETAKPPPIPTGTAVLHIGDSFALAGFAKALKPRMQALGVRYEVRAETSSFTTTWSSKMAGLIANTQPDLVIINLGANEVANTDPPAHAPAIRNIVKAIGGRPCVWVSPPLWRKDTGITEVMREHSAPCRFFDSNELVGQPIPRQGDKIHPTDQGGAIWADAFWSWLQEQRAPAGADDPAPAGAKPPKPSPWRLKPAPPEEHRPRPRP